MKKIRIAAVLSAIIMFVCGFLFISSQGNGNTSIIRGGQISVVVATEDIAPYTMLTSNMLTVKHIAASEVLNNYYTEIDDVDGSVCVSEIYSGEVLTADRVMKKEDAVLGLAARLEEGKRAVSLEVDTEQGVANNLKVGSYVDVIFTAQIEGGQINGAAISAGQLLSGVYGENEPANVQVVGENIGLNFSVIALQNIKIVALDDALSSSGNEGGETQEYGSVTLEVTPDEAAKIALLKDNDGEIRLVLRPLGDESTVNEPRNSVLQRYAQ